MFVLDSIRKEDPIFCKESISFQSLGANENGEVILDDNSHGVTIGPFQWQCNFESVWSVLQLLLGNIRPVHLV